MTDTYYKEWIKNSEKNIVAVNRGDKKVEGSDFFWIDSVHEKSGIIYSLSRNLGKEYLVSIYDKESENNFSGIEIEHNSKIYKFSETNHENAIILRKLFIFTVPTTVGTKNNSFGVGDRLGISSSGHLRVFRKTNIVPILAQQSLRELDLTNRTYSDVIDAASWAVFRSGYHNKWVADGDHLKYPDDIISALVQGCTMITADLSDHINHQFAERSETIILAEYDKIDNKYRERIEKEYLGKHEISETYVLNFTKDALAQIALVYKNGIEYAEILYKTCKSIKDEFDFEISIDETEITTSGEAHYFVAKELLRKNIVFTSIAPRFIGEFQKGIDYIGDTAEFFICFSNHANIAAKLCYKLSVHSASDKFSIYPIIAKNLKSCFHIKTSGTSWLCALKVIAKLDPVFYREIHKYAFQVFPIAKAYYHVTPNLSNVCDINNFDNNNLSAIFENNNDRQVLHIAYGEMLKMPAYKEKIFNILTTNIEEYWDELENHINTHIKLLTY